MRRKITVAACAFAAAVALAAGAKTVDFPIPDAVRSWDIPERATNGVKAVWIENVPWHGKPTRFFAYYSLPEGATAEKKVPGIVLVHGGYGTAFHTWVKLWNDRGYAAIAMDNCGGIPGEKNHTAEHPRHEWSGPNGWGRFEDEALPPEEQWVYHAIECVIRSHTFLRNLPEVDASRIGVTGISWGGFLTSIACGADQRFAFAVPVYGCGNLRRHSVFAPEIGELWESLWNPVEYAKNCRIPTLWCTGTNDYFFPLDSFEETAFAAGNPLFSIKLRMKHGHPPEGDPPEIAAFADSVVKGAPKLTDRKIARREWLYTESANPVWKDRHFEVSAEAPQNWTIRFESAITEDGLILSSPPEFQTATLDAKGVVVNGATIRETERRVFADGMAMRYILPEGERRVEREDTVWTLPADAKVWYQEYGMDYEKPYCSSLVRDIPAGTVMNFPVTAKLADGTYRLITEANVVGFTDSAAKYLGDGRFGVFYVNDPDGFDQKGADTTPWRVMLVAKDLQTLATSDIVRRLCPAPSAEVAAKAAKFTRPGRAVWQWLPAGAPRYEEQKEWYDRTKALGFEYYLIDDGWRDWRDGDMDQWACLKKWIDYGKSIGVETFMWVDSKEMRNAETRRRYLAKVKEAGAVGIKIDFHPLPSFAQMAWYEEALADTLEFGLMTDYHGCVKPSGREKTWPHEVAREAIRGHEWHITRYNRVLPPEHDCILPFNRLVQGHADYTPVVFEKKELAGYTRTRELAQGIIFSAPFLCFGDYPKNYLESPAVELVKALPTTYDETRVLPGSEIGECVALAKRKGSDWFIAVENGAEARKLRIDFGFFGEGEYDMTAFADAAERPDGYAISRRLVGRDGSLDLEIKPKGGFVAWLRRKTGRASVGAPETRAQGLYRCQVHRGGGRDTRPDNSLETFLWCWGHGVAPEADARLTKDGVAIAFHDPTLQRIARGIPGELQTREIKDMAWDEIKDVDVGSYMGEEYATTRIATMDSIFAAMSGRPDRILYLDEKGAPPEMMAEMAKKHGVEKQIYYTSPNFRLMSRWQKVVPGGLGMVWLGTWAKDNSPASVAKADEFLERTFREMEAEGWSGISQIQLHIRTDLTKPDPFCPSTECLKKSIELLHSKGITVQAFTWTEGANKDVLRRIWSLGFDNFATDDPLVLFELLPELRRPDNRDAR